MNKLFNFSVWNFSAFYNMSLGLTDQEKYQQLQCPGCGEKHKGKNTHYSVCSVRSSMTTLLASLLPLPTLSFMFQQHPTAIKSCCLPLPLAPESITHTQFKLWTLKIHTRLRNAASLHSLSFCNVLCISISLYMQHFAFNYFFVCLSSSLDHQLTHFCTLSTIHRVWHLMGA